MTEARIPSGGIQFLRDLATNNSRDWFKANKKRFDDDLKKPASLLAEQVAQDLSAQTGCDMAAKVFRIHRDVRFSKDKTPYNTHIRFAFWPADTDLKAPMSGPGFYLSVEPQEVIAGAGAIAFTPDALARFRDCITGGQARDLSALLTDLTSAGMRLDPPDLKRLPHGYTATTASDESLLRRKGLAVWHHRPTAEPLADITASQCMEGLLATKPVFDWLRSL